MADVGFSSSKQSVESVQTIIIDDSHLETESVIKENSGSPTFSGEELTIANESNSDNDTDIPSTYCSDMEARHGGGGGCIERIENEEYIKPIEDPYEKATRYLSKHDILPLFQVLTAGIAYKRPEDPLNYMISEIEGIRESERLRKGLIKNTTPANNTSSEKTTHVKILT